MNTAQNFLSDFADTISDIAGTVTQNIKAAKNGLLLGTLLTAASCSKPGVDPEPVVKPPVEKTYIMGSTITTVVIDNPNFSTLIDAYDNPDGKSYSRVVTNVVSQTPNASITPLSFYANYQEQASTTKTDVPSVKVKPTLESNWNFNKRRVEGQNLVVETADASKTYAEFEIDAAGRETLKNLKWQVVSANGDTLHPVEPQVVVVRGKEATFQGGALEFINEAKFTTVVGATKDDQTGKLLNLKNMLFGSKKINGYSFK